MAAMDVLQYLREQAYLAAVTGNIQLGEEFRRKGRPFSPYARFLSGGAGARQSFPRCRWTPTSSVPCRRLGGSAMRRPRT